MPSSRTRNCPTCPSRVDSIFCNLPETHLSQLNQQKTTNLYKRGQTLFYEGNAPAGIFCMGTGKIKIFKNGSDGKEVILRVAKGGDVLGLRSIMADQRYAATAEVIEDAEICFISKDFIHHLTATDTEVAFNMLRALGDELGTLEEKVSDLLNKTVRQRFARLLLALQKTYGKNVDGGTYLDIRLSRQELASMVGATPETVIRLLSDLKDEGCVGLEGKKIVLKNTEQLLSDAALDV